MSMDYKNSTFVPSAKTKNPMNSRDSMFDQLLGKEKREKIIWMIIAIFGLIYALCSFLLYKHAIDLPKAIPMVIEVSSWGEARNLGDVSNYSYNSISVSDKAKKWQINQFITDLRSISSDVEIVKSNIADIYTMITTACEQKVRDQFTSPDIYTLVGKKKVVVTIETIIQVSENSYQIDWYENCTGKEVSNKRYRGVVTIALLTPSAKQSEKNPLGIYITDYNIVEIGA